MRRLAMASGLPYSSDVGKQVSAYFDEKQQIMDEKSHKQSQAEQSASDFDKLYNKFG